MFVSIYTHPSVVDGPSLTLLNRDLMQVSDSNIVEHAMPSFLRHGRLWVSPKNVALASISSNPPVLPCNIAKITTLPIDINKSTEALLLTRTKTFSLL